MYTASTFVMNHRAWFHPTEPPPPPRYVVEREVDDPGEFPPGATSPEIARQLLAMLNLDGAHQVVRPFSPTKVVINRLDPITPRRITYHALDHRVVVEKMIFEGPRFLEQMHRRRGFQHDYVLEDLWAASVDLTIVALVALALTGLWMWWELRVTRRWGAIALAAGCGLFALFLAVL